MSKQIIGVLGATSLVGDCLLSAESLSGMNSDVEFVAFSRRNVDSTVESSHNVSWHNLSEQSLHKLDKPIELWICLAPIWVVPHYFTMLKKFGALRIVALSSTSRFTKEDSTDTSEMATAHKLVEGEKLFQDWAKKMNIEWVILRPTLIYGLARDRNISDIARIIHRLRFFPLPGEGSGLRQPIHAKDVAGACLAAVTLPGLKSGAYTISGGEVLKYKEMVKRVFLTLNIKPRFIHFPRWTFYFAVLVLKLFPSYRHLTIAMVDRVNRDMVFEHTNAKAELGFSPGTFQLDLTDIPVCCNKVTR